MNDNTDVIYEALKEQRQVTYAVVVKRARAAKEPLHDLLDALRICARTYGAWNAYQGGDENYAPELIKLGRDRVHSLAVILSQLLEQEEAKSQVPDK